jgi:hypothetical protein
MRMWSILTIADIVPSILGPSPHCIGLLSVTESIALRPSQGIEHRYAEATATTLMGSFGTGPAAETLHNIALERFRR